MNNALNIWVKRVLDILFYIGLVLEVLVPISLRKAVELVIAILGEHTEYAAINDHYIFAVITIMCAGAMALLILKELRSMMSTVIKDDCFVQKNVTSLDRMALYAFIIAAVKLLRNLIYFTPASLVTAAVFLFAGLLSKVLARVFDKAVRYKEENDLTI